MPHALFLGSYLATQDRESPLPECMPLPATSTTKRERLSAYFRSFFTITRAERIAVDRHHRNQFIRPENNTLQFVQAHLGHGLVDIVTSLLGVAVPINSAYASCVPCQQATILKVSPCCSILIIAATVFFNKDDIGLGNPRSVGLFDAYDLIQQFVGRGTPNLVSTSFIR
jgi:metal iron transporter